MADQAAASMNISTEELLAASPMTQLLKDVLSYSPDHEQHDIDVPTFTSRYAAQYRQTFVMVVMVCVFMTEATFLLSHILFLFRTVC